MANNVAMQRGQPFPLTLMTAPGDSDIVAVPRPVAGVSNTFTWAAKPNSVTALASTLYGSLDGTTWIQVDTNSTTAAYGKSLANQGWLFFKVTVTTLTGTSLQLTFHVA